MNIFGLLSDFKINKGLSAGAIAGIVIGSCAIVVSVLTVLWMKGYLGGKDPDR